MGAGRQTKGRGGKRPTRQAPPSGTTAAGIASAARVQSRGCKGRSPLHKITFSPPLPRGVRALYERGSGGYPSPSGKGGKNKSKGRGGRQPTRQAPLGHHSGTGRSIRVLQTRQKRLSRFCNTRHPSRHARAQAKAGTGRERRLPPIIIRSGKVLGGVGDSFKSPPAHPRILASPFPIPPVRHGDGGRGCRSRRSGRRRGGGRRRRRPRGQRRGGRGTGRSRPCRRG